MGLLRSACDGLAGPVSAPAVMGHRDDHIAGWPGGDEHHHAATRLPPPEAPCVSRLEMGTAPEANAYFTQIGLGQVRDRPGRRRLRAAPASFNHRPRKFSHLPSHLW